MHRAVPGIIALIILAGAIMLSGCASEEPQVATDQVANATLVHGHVYKDGQPVSGAQVEALSVDGSQRITNITDDNGTYILGLRPRVWYRITASSGSLKHSVLPVYVPDKGELAGAFDINLSGMSTIEGGPTNDSRWRGDGIYIAAAPANGDEPVLTVTGDDGSYSLAVKPGIYYTVSARYYDLSGTAYNADIYYRNSIKCSKVKPGKDETILLDYHTWAIFLRPELIVNGTVGMENKTAEPPARAPTSPIEACGRVYLDNKTVSGAKVEAISIDGSDRVSASTNDTGIYCLRLEPGVLYRATATYGGLNHTIWPVSPSQNPDGGRNDVFITSSHMPTIAVVYGGGDWYSSAHILIEAIPADGGKPISATTNGTGIYYIDVKPDVPYSLSGRCYDPYGQTGGVYVNYPPDVQDRQIALGTDETVITDMSLTFHHPPVGMFIWRDPATGKYEMFKPAGPAAVIGRVFIDDRPADGANVTAALAGSPEIKASAIADSNGNYVLNISSRNQYDITATWGGRKQTIWPVVVQDYSTGVYDIQLFQRTTSAISGTLDLDSTWPTLQGNVITAVPVGGGENVTAVTGPRGNYSLQVKPFTYYDMTGTSKGADGVNHSLRLYYKNGITCDGFMLRPDETALIDYGVY